MLKKILIIVITLILGLEAYFIYFVFIPEKSDYKLSAIQLQSKINRIASDYKNIFTNCKFFTMEQKKRFENDGIPEINNMTEGQIIISIGGGDSVYRDISNNEIYGIFECWLFVKEKKLPFEVIAICWSYSTEGAYTTTDRTTTISRSEFDWIFQNTNIDNMDVKNAAKALGDNWIEFTGYSKQG